MVGWVTLRTQVNGLYFGVIMLVTYSGPGTCWRIASGGVPGQMGTCVCPGEGCQTFVCASRRAGAKTIQRTMIKDFIAVRRQKNGRRMRRRQGVCDRYI